MVFLEVFGVEIDNCMCIYICMYITSVKSSPERFSFYLDQFEECRGVPYSWGNYERNRRLHCLVGWVDPLTK